MKFMNIQSALVLLVALVFLTGCDKLKQMAGFSDWKKTEASSVMDGQQIHVNKTFASDNKMGFIDVDISCYSNSKAMSVTLSSSVSQSDPNRSKEASPFTSASDNKLSGRIKFGAEPPQDLALVFSLTKDPSVAVWNLIQEVAVDNACGFLNSDKSTTETSVLCEQTARDKRISYVPAALAKPDFVAILNKAPTGNYLSPKLPVAIEVSNAGATFEIVIPADDRAINSAIQSCSGEKPIFLTAKTPTAPTPAGPVQGATPSATPAASAVAPAGSADQSKAQEPSAAPAPASGVNTPY